MTVTFSFRLRRRILPSANLVYGSHPKKVPPNFLNIAICLQVRLATSNAACLHIPLGDYIWTKVYIETCWTLHFKQTINCKITKTTHIWALPKFLTLFYHCKLLLLIKIIGKTQLAPHPRKWSHKLSMLPFFKILSSFFVKRQITKLI